MYSDSLWPAFTNTNIALLTISRIISIGYCVFQVKSYPRQWWVKGRVRVSLKDKDGNLINPAIPDRALTHSLHFN